MKLKQIYQNILKEEEYFSTTLPSELDRQRKLLNTYVGKNVIWFGNENMAIIDVKDIFSRHDNIFSSDKLNYVEKLIINSNNKVEFSCGYAFPTLIEISDIVEDLQDSSYQFYGRDLTTGNDDLDTYIKNETYYSDTYNEDFAEDLDSEKMEERNISEFRQELIDKYDLEDYEDEIEYLDEALEEYEELENSFRNAINTSSGDINRILFQLRDGNHRTQGAIRAGEEYVGVNIVIDSETYKQDEILKRINFVKK